MTPIAWFMSSVCPGIISYNWFCMNVWIPKPRPMANSMADAGTIANNVRNVMAHACDCKLVSMKDRTERFAVLTTFTQNTSRVSLHTPPEQ